MNSSLQGGPVVLDAEGLARTIIRDPYMQSIIKPGSTDCCRDERHQMGAMAWWAT